MIYARRYFWFTTYVGPCQLCLQAKKKNQATQPDYRRTLQMDLDAALALPGVQVY